MLQGLRLRYKRKKDAQKKKQNVYRLCGWSPHERMWFFVAIKIDGMVEILKGINADDLVVYEGINKIRDGSAVKIKWIIQNFL